MPLPAGRDEMEAADSLENASLGLLTLGVLSLFIGAVVGLVGAIFRLALQQADLWRSAGITWLHAHLTGGVVVVVAACAATTGVAAWLVRKYARHASGSGIPHVECVLEGKIPPAQWRLIPVKFVGGLLAIGSGLALGREGPSVQIGATLALLLGRAFRRNGTDCLVLLAAGAGAGLATAFNAPIAGAIFVLEELVRRFNTRITVATFGTSAGAIGVSRLFLGNLPDFSVASLPYPDQGTMPMYLGLGVLAGLLGVAYNRTLLGALAATQKLGRWPVEVRAATIGAAVGLLAWFAPGWVGGGDDITQRTLDATGALNVLMLLFVVRFFLGPVSYAALTPGGLFAPLLVLGAQCGALMGLVLDDVAPALAPNATALAVVGMAAFFTAVVRAPLTGIILVIEMTGGMTLLLPMLAACFAAMLVPTLLRDPPIYDSLRAGTLRIQEEETGKP